MVSSGHFEIFVSLLFLALTGECRKLKFPASFSFTDKLLKGHTIRTSQVLDIDICELLCCQEPYCVSINFKYEVHSGAGGSYNCELNNSTHLGHDQDFVKAKGYIYRGAESACDKAPCENGGTCQAGFTEKGFRCLCPAHVIGIRCEHVIEVSCRDIKMKGHSKGDGMYWLDPDGGSHSNAFLAYCDMKSYNGGWTMCYTTDEYAKPRTEVKYNATFPYGTDGYRTNCNNVKFTEIMFIDHQTGRKAYFTRRSRTRITAADNYRNNNGRVYGLWDGVLPDGLAASNYHSYQLLICDEHFFSGFFVSAYTNSCYKHCRSWCNDKQSPYFRTASTNPGYKGVAFNENGHRPLSNRLISVGLR